MLNEIITVFQLDWNNCQVDLDVLLVKQHFPIFLMSAAGNLFLCAMENIKLCYIFMLFFV